MRGYMSFQEMQEVGFLEYMGVMLKMVGYSLAVCFVLFVIYFLFILAFSNRRGAKKFRKGLWGGK